MSDTLPHIESIFMDSGAHTLYNVHVLKSTGKKKREGRHGRELEAENVVWGRGDFSYFDLSRGSPFRKYCDTYASFIKKFSKYVDFFATVDAISNPDITWEIQRYFEEEHGVQPVPIVHYGTPMKYVDRYLQTGRYDFLGVGGLGQGVSRAQYYTWGDEFFCHICPESNNYLPLVKTHGFAMTSWDLIVRWPWWSVDSATWVKVAAYGHIIVPRSSEDSGFRFDRPPLMITLSNKSPNVKERDKHYKNSRDNVKAQVRRWLDEIGIALGSEDENGEEVERGVLTHHQPRSLANIHYFQRLAASRPEWPNPLDKKIVAASTVKYQKGFGL